METTHPVRSRDTRRSLPLALVAVIAGAALAAGAAWALADANDPAGETPAAELTCHGHGRLGLGAGSGGAGRCGGAGAGLASVEPGERGYGPGPSDCDRRGRGARADASADLRGRGFGPGPGGGPQGEGGRGQGRGFGPGGGPGPGRGAGFGGEHPGPHLAMLDRMPGELALTDEQWAKILGVMGSAREAIHPLKALQHERHDGLRDQMHAEPMNEEAIRAGVMEMAAIQADLAVAMAKTRTGVLALLTPGQKEYIEAADACREQQRERRRLHRGEARGGSGTGAL